MAWSCGVQPPIRARPAPQAARPGRLGDNTDVNCLLGTSPGKIKARLPWRKPPREAETRMIFAHVEAEPQTRALIRFHSPGKRLKGIPNSDSRQAFLYTQVKWGKVAGFVPVPNTQPFSASDVKDYEMATLRKRRHLDHYCTSWSRWTPTLLYITKHKISLSYLSRIS